MKHALVKDGEIVEFRHFAPNVDQLQLAEGKPRWLPVEIEGYEPFDPASEVRAGPVYTVDARRVVEEYTVLPKSEDDILTMKLDKVAAIKAEAQRRILEIMPSHRQTNWLALKAEMDFRHGPDPANWPADVQQAVSVVLPLWDQIKALRVRSDAIEASLMALTTASAVDAFNPQAGWTA